MRSPAAAGIAAGLTLGLMLAGPQAAAEHTDPKTQLSSTDSGFPGEGTTRGEGTWELIRNFRANPGSDLEFFRKKGRLYVASGTLGQATEEHVGQRIVRLSGPKGFNPGWTVDHGSAHCGTANPGGTLGLQHDSQVDRFVNARVLIDTTDATGRCHDPDGGGLEIIDIRRLGKKPFEENFDTVREMHLTRHAGTSHTHTVDAKRPWIVYNSSSEFSGRPWIDIVDIQSCLEPGAHEQLVRRCRPRVSRIEFEFEWSQARDSETGELKEGTEASCHDITSVGNRLYCAGLNATLIFDVRDLTRPNGKVRGPALPCELVDGTDTPAKVTDCSAVELGAPQARGWEFLGTFNHPGRDCFPAPVTTCNSNLRVPATEGVAVAHEADPSHDGQFMFVTDERGGGVVPPGASCEPGVDNPFGNGGIHVFDISDPSNIEYAQDPDGNKAVFITDPIIPAESFCTVHVIEHIPEEQRLAVAWYSQGVKLVDYFIDGDGAWTFRETASLVLPSANTWSFEDFRIEDNGDGTKTYFFVASDIQRGIDIISWTGPSNPIGTPPPTD